MQMRQKRLLGAICIGKRIKANHKINAVNIFQPDIVCLGGGVCNEGEALLEPLRKLIEKERYPVEQSHPFTLCKAQLGNDAGIIGAALLGLETYDK